VPAEAFAHPDRPIAEIISPIWHTEEERDAAGESEQLIRLLGIEPGMSVGDIGAGSGYHTVRLARAVGPSGRVFAEDITPDYLRDLAERVRALGLTNVTVARGEAHDPRLPPVSLDMAILVHMYHEITQPFGLMYNLVPALKPGARVGIVDADANTWEHGTPPWLLRCEVEAVGYRQTGYHRLTGGVGYLAVFAPPPHEARKPPSTIKPCAVKRS
jgi:predicted methyltransferase